MFLRDNNHSNSGGGDARRRRRRPAVLACLLFVMVLIITTVTYLPRGVAAHDKRLSSIQKKRPRITCRDKNRCRLPPSSYNQVRRGGENRFVMDDDYNNGIRRGNNNKGNIKSRRNHSGAVYQYFGRSRSRGGGPSSQTEDTPINFILLGPNVGKCSLVAVAY